MPGTAMNGNEFPLIAEEQKSLQKLDFLSAKLHTFITYTFINVLQA